MSIRNYPSLSFTELHKLPEKPGVYYIWHNGGVVYVGQSKNLRQRWTAKGDRIHHNWKYVKAKKRPGRLYYRLVPIDRLDYEEAKDIFRFDPILNLDYPDPSRYKPRFEGLGLIGNVGMILLTIAIILYGASRLPVDRSDLPAPSPSPQLVQ